MINKLLLLVILFFLFWRSSLSYLLWSGRITPPVTDDSYVYLSNIESVRTCPTLIFCQNNLYQINSAQAYDRLAYRLPLGLFARIAGISSREIFILSFFLGNVFLLASVYLFLSALNPSRLLKIFWLLTLAFFNGNGLYHGFYWLVPSAYALGLFFLTFYVITRYQKSPLWYLLVLIPVGIYTHLIYLYLIVIPLIYNLVFSILNKKIQSAALFRSLIALLIAAAAYFPVDLYLQKVSKGYSYGIINSFQKFASNRSSEVNNRASLRDSTHLFQSLDSITNYYFRPLFSIPIVAVGFLSLVGILVFRKKKEILSLYLSSLIFTLVSSVSLFGYRSLLLLWPVTLMLISSGILEFILSTLKIKIAAFCLTLIFIGVVSLLGAQSILFTLVLNQDHTWDVNEEAFTYIKTNIYSSEPVYYAGKIPESYIGSNSLYTLLSRTLDPEKACYYFSGYPNPKTYLTRLDQLLKALSLNQTLSDKVSYPQNINQFTHLAQFGSLHIYQNEQCLKSFK